MTIFHNFDQNWWFWRESTIWPDQQGFVESGEYDISALHLAALHGHTDTVERLVIKLIFNFHFCYFTPYNLQYIGCPQKSDFKDAAGPVIAGSNHYFSHQAHVIIEMIIIGPVVNQSSSILKSLFWDTLYKNIKYVLIKILTICKCKLPRCFWTLFTCSQFCPNLEKSSSHETETPWFLIPSRNFLSFCL